MISTTDSVLGACEYLNSRGIYKYDFITKMTTGMYITLQKTYNKVSLFNNWKYKARAILR